MKKTLFLLPIAILALAGCTGGGTNPEPSPTPTPTPTPAKGDYGTADNPLTVAEWKVKVAELVPAEAEAFSEHPFYVVGIPDKNAAFPSGTYQQFDTFFLHDDVTDTESCKVQRAKKGESFDGGNKLYKNDTVVVRGYAEYYSGSYSLFPFDSDEEEGDVNVLSRTLGASPVTVEGCEHATFTPLAATAQNGSTLQLTAAADTGWVLTVKVNNAEVTKVGDTYPINVEGDTAVVLSVTPDIVPEDLPAGTYDLQITLTNNGLTDDALASDTTVNVPVIADTATKVYKKLTLAWPAGAKNKSNYSEFELPKDKKLVVTTPTGNITKLTADMYKSFDANVYAGSSESATEVSVDKGSVSSNHMPVTSANFSSTAMTIKAQTGSGKYAPNFYSFTVKIVVA